MTSLVTSVAPAAAIGGGRDRVLTGIGLMLASTLLLSISNLLAKILVGRYPIGEVMFFRSSGAFVLCCAVLLPTNGLSIFRTRKPFAHVARGTSQAISQTLTVAALSLLPLASVTAIGFSAPLFAAVLAIFVFRERTDPIRSGALILGFCGVLAVTHPGAETFQLGALLALGNAVMYGSVTVAVRRMTKTESAGTLLMWQMAVMTAAHTALLFCGFRWPVGSDVLLFAGLGVSNAGAQFLWTRALAAAPSTVVSPLYYVMLVWGVVFGFLFFGEVPTAPLIVGALVVIASGLALVLHEARFITVEAIEPHRLASAARQAAMRLSRWKWARRSATLSAGTALL